MVYGRHLLVLWPKKSEFLTFLSIDYKFSVDYLHSRPLLSVNYLEALIEKCISLRYVNKITLPNGCIFKLADLLETNRNVSLTKHFISYIIATYPNEIIQRILKLIAIYGWEALGESVIELMTPVTLDNISNNCMFVQVSQLFLLNNP